jgi:hypothetical protein
LISSDLGREGRRSGRELVDSGALTLGGWTSGEVRAGEEVEVAYWTYTVETIAEGGEGGGLREEHE